MPFKLSSLAVAHVVDATKNKDTKNLWNLNLMLVNDIYLKIEKNPNKEDVIKSIKITNMNITKMSEKGDIKITTIQKDEEGLNIYTTDDMREFLFNGEQKTDLEKLTISNQGGTIGFRCMLENLTKYVSNEDEINYNGELLQKAKITQEQVQMELSFELFMELESGIIYTGDVQIPLPMGTMLEHDNIITELSQEELEKIIFKRI